MMINRRIFIRILLMLPFISIFPRKAIAFWPLALRILLRGVIRAGARSAARRLILRGASKAATRGIVRRAAKGIVRNPVIRSGRKIRRHSLRAPKGRKKKLPTPLRMVVKETIKNLLPKSGPNAYAAESNSFEVPNNAPMYVVGEKKVKFEIVATNQSNSYQPCKLDFFLYDIDADEVECVIKGPFGYLEPNISFNADLYIPEMLYPGRKILITEQNNTDTRTSEVFYIIET